MSGDEKTSENFINEVLSQPDRTNQFLSDQKEITEDLQEILEDYERIKEMNSGKCVFKAPLKVGQSNSPLLQQKHIQSPKILNFDMFPPYKPINVSVDSENFSFSSISFPTNHKYDFIVNSPSNSPKNPDPPVSFNDN
ncbi:hypothetical protein PCE1_002564 [Barthelona sp. PCE]